MKPAMMGPTGGPMKGEAVKIIMGACSSFRPNISPTVPPATLKKARTLQSALPLVDDDLNDKTSLGSVMGGRAC